MRQFYNDKLYWTFSQNMWVNESHDQFKAHSLFPKPEVVKEALQEKLRSAGISFRKAGYLAISENFSDLNYS